MGGVAGHLSHLYDNRNLTYNKMAEILQKAAQGELIGAEKTDGFNIYLGFVDGKARFARNKGDMAAGGMTINELSARVFKGGDSAKEVFINSFKSYEKAVNSLSIKERAQIFGPAGEIFYNSEIQGQRRILKDGKEVFVPLNVVNYDENILNIHRVGHKKYNKATNKLEIVNTVEQSAFLDELIARFDEITLNESFKIKRTALLELNKLTDDTFVENILNTIKNTGYSGDMTIDDYLESQFKPIIDQKFANLDENMRQALVNRILKKDNAQSLIQISKGLLKEEKEEISAYVLKSSPLAIQKMMEPIELAIHNFSVKLLKELKSAYIRDNAAEIKRLKLETKRAIETIRDYRDLDYDKAHNILAKQITKLKHHDNIDTVVEGFVFEYDDQMYKFTGNFAPMNQLLGLFRFGRGNIPPMLKEAVLEQNEADNEEKTDLEFIIDLLTYLTPVYNTYDTEADVDVQHWMGNLISTLKMYEKLARKRSPEKAAAWFKPSIEELWLGRTHYDWLMEYAPQYAEGWKNRFLNKSLNKEIIAIYPGRFQPMGKHHAKVFTGDGEVPGIQDIYGKDNSFIATSDAKIKPNSPFTFAQKKKIIEAHGIDPNVIFKVKNPYYAKEITNNYDPETYRVVYLVGAKDMAENPRFAKTEGTTKEGFDWSIEVAPHVSIEIPEYGEMCGTTCRLALKDATEEEFEAIMGFKNPEVYEMIKDVLSKQILSENTQFLDIFRELTDEVLLEEGFFKSKKERVLDKVQKDFNLTLQSNWTKPPHLRKGRELNPDVKRVRQWIELGATSTMINQIFTLMYYGELKQKNGINRIYYSVPSQTIKDPYHSNSIFTKIRVEERMQAGKELWDARANLISKEPMSPIVFFPRERAPQAARYIGGALVDIDAVNYYKSLGLKLKDIIEKDSVAVAGDSSEADNGAEEEPGSRIRRASDELYKNELAKVKTWQEFVALNNYPPAVEIINDKLVESEKSKNARKDHLENVVHKALPLPMPLKVVISGKFNSWIKGAGARYGGGLSLATPKGEEGALSVADETGQISLAEKYVKRPCKKKSKTKGDKTGNCAVVSHKTGKQKACYDDCDEARAAMHLEEEEELEEHGLAGYAGPIGRPRRRKIKEQEVNEALNYLLQKLGV